MLPEAHTVAIKLAPERLAEVPGGECAWSFAPRAGAAKAETKKQACKDTLTIRRVPYSPDAKVSGVSVKVVLPGGRELTETVVVEDVLVVAMGNSFMSGESNPDRPVVFSATREMTYDPANLNTREDVATRKVPQPNFGLASIDIDPKTLPRRRLADEEQGLIFRPASREFQNAFDQRGAQWLSADCHRSPALGQAGPTDFTGGQPPCGDYYGSEYGTYCRPGMDGRVGRHTCAYRTGPPCPAARVRAPPRR